MTIRTYTHWDKSFFKEWETLWNRSPFANYTNAPYWFLSVTESFTIKDFIIYGFYQNKKLLGVIWLIKTKKHGISIYSQIPNDFICGSPFLIDSLNISLMNQIITKVEDFGTVYFDNVPEHLAKNLHKLNKHVLVAPFTLNYFLTLPKQNSTFEQLPNRKILLRRANKFEKDISFQIYTGFSEKIFNQLYEIDGLSRKNLRGYGLFISNEMKMFYHLLARHFSKHFRVHILYYKKKPIAYEFGFAIHKIYYGTQLSFVDEYSYLAPGKVLIVYVLDALVKEGFKKVDFGSGDSHVKRLITNEKQKLCKVVISKNQFKSHHIKNVESIKNVLYHAIESNKTVYKIYRNFKNF